MVWPSAAGEIELVAATIVERHALQRGTFSTSTLRVSSSAIDKTALASVMRAVSLSCRSRPKVLATSSHASSNAWPMAFNTSGPNDAPWHHIPKGDAWKQAHLAMPVRLSKRAWLHCDDCRHSIMIEPRSPNARVGAGATSAEGR